MDRRNCHGCKDDFYNLPGNSTGGKCWLRDKAKVVTRFRIGTWTMPLQPGAFVEVRVPDCYRQDGQHFSDRPHPEAVDVVRIRRGRKSQ